MPTEMGELLVGAWLKEIKGCQVVDYNVKFGGSGILNLSELDVLGLDFDSRTAYLCEVATHLDGLQYSKHVVEDGVQKVKKNNYDKILANIAHKSATLRSASAPHFPQFAICSGLPT